jgi:hypothetical protein
MATSQETKPLVESPVDGFTKIKSGWRIIGKKSG